MEGFIFSPYKFYPGYGPYGNPNQKPKQPNWNKKGISSYVAPESVDYFDLCKRAQLKALLSQINPNLTPRLRKANTREIGVQVNPKVDAVVQCSLGPRTLFYRQTKGLTLRPPIKSLFSFKNKFMPSIPVNNTRFSRPIAVYSPMFDRRFLTLTDKAKPTEKVNYSDSEEETLSEGEQKNAEDIKSDAEIKRDGKTATGGHESAQEKKFRFQFLEQKYGFFHCSDCNIRWESAYVWCISGTNKVYFKQLCRKCQQGYNPYKVESIQCQTCSKSRCNCPMKKRHIDIKRPHRQELCGRCKGKRLSCESTYSFKYIV
ncbi:zygote arrest protein 1-like [Acipenser oxyrinchus oxyrinchus]|uniref:Zygote arrest protein 1-like n=1 Tax=Acipenser oxyrinchus oxyrinchus TaxID=40147 RepID=A0AAD8DGA2_ACIOX|nr:zygote arrest protein 1-like [Acipenser oxyrinchus oxyrinchus]